MDGSAQKIILKANDFIVLDGISPEKCQDPQTQLEPKKFRMNDDAHLYQNSNGIPKRDTINFLDQYKNRMNFRKHARAIDIGCADGGVTSIIKSYLSSDFKTLVGCDINENMIKHAARYHADDRTAFRVLDIEGNLPEDMKKGFDHVFSFFTLQWIRNQELAFRNIYNLLDDGGDCLLVFLGSSPTYTLFQALAENEKWKPYLRDVNNYVSPYHDMQEPDRLLEDIFTRIGFQFFDVRCKQMLYYYDSIQSFKETTKAINPFHVPDFLYEDLIDDYVQLAGDMKMILNAGGTSVVKMKYNLIVVFARK